MVMKKHTPEIGQAFFGQESKEYAVEEILQAALLMISKEWDRVMWNINQKEMDSPFSNTGARWECDTFKLEAYSWNDEYEQPYNFKYKDIEVSWYKYFGRGMSVNKEVAYDEVQKMIVDCLNALRKYEQERNKF
jgi:hypothetical protein